MGAYCAAGAGAAALWDAAAEGRSSAEWRDFGASGGFAVCAAPEIDPAGAGVPRFRTMDRCTQLASLAAREAWEHAAISGVHPPERIGIAVGSSRGALWNGRNAIGAPVRRVASIAPHTTFASLSGALAQTFRCLGPGMTLSAACASAAFAIAYAAEQILLGNADAMLAGGAEAPLEAALLDQFQAAGVLGSHDDPRLSCRPFDVTRNGFAVGEGSAFLVLEKHAAAEARGAAVFARLAGWGTGTDHTGRVGVDSSGAGLTRVMRRALETADLQPGQIDYINAHGAGTRLGDAAESQAVLGMFGSAIPCTSTKPVTGHCMGATAALETVLCAHALRRQVIPPTANCFDQDPLCAIAVQPLKTKSASLAYAMSNSLGFWGCHASLIFGAV